jgi:glycosyltransferase involved in cell wall biosynthesis
LGIDSGGIALVHDYLTQRGGAERVVLSLARAFPGAPLYTSFFDRATTFSEFEALDVRPLPLDAVAALRRRHRLALPLLAPAFSGLRIDAEAVVCSSSGWAHGVRVRGRKIVYCHAPARWLYQRERYLGDKGVLARAGLSIMRTALERWDRRAASTADRYLTNSTWIARAVASAYGIEALVVPPPVTIDPGETQEQVPGLQPGYVLCVSRLLPYKNVGAVVDAFAKRRALRLVVVGDGPEEARLRAAAGSNVRFEGVVGEPRLRWLYANARCLVAASYEDFGLTPLEAAAFGKPVAALRFGGFLDTVQEGVTGVLFDRPDAADIAQAVDAVLSAEWNHDEIRSHAGVFSEDRFVDRVRAVVAEALDVPSPGPLEGRSPRDVARNL